MPEFEEKCGVGRLIRVEKKHQPERLSPEAFVTEANRLPVTDGQHFVGAGIDPEHLKELIERCRRCEGQPERACDINTRTFQQPEPQT